MSAAAMRHWKRGRGVHIWQSDDRPAPLYARGLNADADEDQDQREKNAQLRLLQKGHRNPADPGTSETLGPNVALAFWLGFAACALIIGLTCFFWALAAVNLNG